MTQSLPQEIISKKRDGQPLSPLDIQTFIDGVTHNTWIDAQISALTMAIFFQGLNKDEIVNLTNSMLHSGTTIDWGALNLIVSLVETFVSGGVGDKVSLILAPVIAAAGGYVPMISGRGLGHTGGTLDKMNAIPGYQTNISVETLQHVVKTCGCAIIGQTSELAPADRRLYAIRDITATVESIPLITASILSKKLSAGLDSIVFDVKFGSGAFMPNYQASHQLAQSLNEISEGLNLKAVSVLTDMNEVLGLTAGHNLELLECVDYLTGAHQNAKLHRVTKTLSAELMYISGLAPSFEKAEFLYEHIINSGKACTYFDNMVRALGGPKDFCETARDHLTTSPLIYPVFANTPGYIKAINTKSLGYTLIKLGGGRLKPEDKLDYRVGYAHVKPVGTYVDDRRIPLLVLHAQTMEQAEYLEEEIRTAFTLCDTPCKMLEPIADTLHVR